LLIKYNFNPAENGGLHIHVDISELIKEYRHQSLARHEFFMPKTKEIYKYKNYIFKAFHIDKDTYDYNNITRKGKFLSVQQERHRISIFRRHESVEWRLANSTLDYVQIVKWIMLCTLFTATIRNQNKRFKVDLYENVKRL
jgi:hypothetical protein